MGEFIFTIAYGSSLIVLGFITRGYLKKMEQQASQPTLPKKVDKAV
ncbi:hypothetical protein LAV72_04305 [Lysinibacillus xylanilyticus]|nr:hypothetical protein [Lysinibacillus xylanilyticus]MEB2298847.1 hypothetical protein [Lysinibacillus xylanilyticus]